MTALGRTYTFSDSDKYSGSRIDLEIQALNDIWNNHDSALLAWTKLNVSGTTKFNGAAYTWPSALPGATSILQTTSGGTLSWATALGAYAPVGSAYVTIGADSTLTSERALTQGAGISVTDGGAGSIVTIANTGVTSNVAGTAISVSGATGAVTINNTGVTSLTGTANRVTVSAATGGVTLSGPQDLATGSSPTFVGGTFTGTLDGQGLLKGKGTATNGDAAAGYIGEYLESVVASNTSVGSTDTFFDLTSLTLTAGDWDVTGLAQYFVNSATFTSADFELGIGTATGNSSAGLSAGVNYVIYGNSTVLGTSGDIALDVPVYRISLSGTTTYYLKGWVGTYTLGTPKYRCRLSARRMR